VDVSLFHFFIDCLGEGKEEGFCRAVDGEVREGQESCDGCYVDNPCSFFHIGKAEFHHFHGSLAVQADHADGVLGGFFVEGGHGSSSCVINEEADVRLFSFHQDRKETVKAFVIQACAEDTKGRFYGRSEFFELFSSSGDDPDFIQFSFFG